MITPRGIGSFVAGLALVLGGLAFFTEAPARLALAPGEPAPPLAGRLFPSGQVREVDWSENTLTLVNFWASWCKPCLDEMPRLQKLYEAQAARGFEIVGVYDPQMTNEQVERYVGPMGITYALLEPGRIVDIQWGGIGALPASFLIDGQGKVLRRYVGALPEQTDGLVADVEAVLDGRSMEPLVMPVIPEDAPPPEPVGSIRREDR